MEAQMKRGFLEACVLAAVSGEESYGYQIVKDVPARMGVTAVSYKHLTLPKNREGKS